ncbi:autotransporter assembly complex protein TamA [Parerythrobacter jejuensis]|uniref:autotransporter assembly complex protein TamA n=1 Tax=Parerythrobacter jejuensis TaxID=795812 RepID=UPI001F2524CF|nr:BamA/TamA family outer membrane protein [Parerythrobacter jejuensis]
MAQDPADTARLDDLIPDEAVADSEAWAADGVPPEEPTPIDTTGAPVPPVDLRPDSPLAEMPELSIEWPERLELPSIEPLEADDDVRFAGIDQELGPLLPDARTVALTDQLVLAFPNGDNVFPLQDVFVERFNALSTIEAYEDGDSNVAQLAARARADEELLANLLRVYGYYDGQVIRTVGPASAESADERPQVRFDIVPGPRYNFGAIDLGQLDQAPDFASLRNAFEIRSGDPMSSDQIVEEQIDLDVALGETGYPFAKIDAPELLIDHDRGEGDLTLKVTPGGKYVLGQVNSNLPRFLSDKHLLNISRFDPGYTFKRSIVSDLRRAVTATGLVSSVTVTPREVQAPIAGEPGIVDLDVEMAKAPLRTIAGAVGYGSEEGFRIQGSWEHRNLFPPEGSLRIRGIIGTQEQLAGITFRKNNFGGRDKILTVDAYASDVETDAFDAKTVALRGAYERVSNLLFQKPFSWQIGAEVLATDERNRVIGGIERPRQTYFIGSAFGRAAIDSTDSLLDPTEGFRVAGFVAPEISQTSGERFFYVRSQADASIYKSVGERVVLAGRLRGATVAGAPTFAIAPSRRLYAGGGGSVRGYGFQTIGPKNDLGEPTGGRSLVEASVEARIQTGFLDGAVSVVPFFDAASVSIESTPDFRFIKYAAGVGVRYKTGFGPIRVDVGVPLNPDPDDSPVAVYVSLGQAF